ncbi:O-fucosyltransferase 29 [Glycine soja]
MGVWKARLLSTNLLLLHPNAKHVCWRSTTTTTTKSVSWSVICCVMLFGLGLISLLTGHVASHLEWYSHRLRHRALYYSTPDGSDHAPIDIWESQYSKYYYGCKERGRHFRQRKKNNSFWDIMARLGFRKAINEAKDQEGRRRCLLAAVRERKSKGYLLIATSGGLNQQRNGITDAVVVARILNATLVVPELDHQSFWKDDSDFANIFDMNWFITYLAKDITIVKRVPDKVMRSMEKPPYTMRVPRKSEPEYYLDQVLPILSGRRVLQLTKFDYRLANNLDDELQKLRCRVNYHALRFTKPIRELGQRLVMRMRKMASRYIAVHLRFESDMLAFSGCYFGGGEKERRELGEIRKRWTTLPDLSHDGERKRGKCPLTPHEVGLMLRALGFTNDTYLYVASGEIYGGDETMQPLRDVFPNIYTKEMLAQKEELKPFLPFSSRLAAIDYIVCDESNVFVTNNNGNMAKILAGRRRYMGHKRTIRPNAKKLSALFMSRHEMDWDTFASKVKACQRGFMGEPDEMRPGRGEFHEYPSTCVCEKPFMDDLSQDGFRPPKLAANNMTVNGGGNEESVRKRSGRMAST